MDKNKTDKDTQETEYLKISDPDEEPAESIEDTALNKLWIVSAVCLIFMIIEVIGGYIANSIAIMSDAAHMFSDLLGFLISIVSIYIAKKSATHHMSYGFHRAEVVGALVSVTIIWGLTVWLLYEAFLRLVNPREVQGGIMLIIAILGLLFNIVMGLILAYEGIDHGMHNHSHGEEEHAHKEDDHDHEDHDHVHRDDIKQPLLDKDTKEDHGHEHEHDGKHSHGLKMGEETDRSSDHKHDHSHDRDHSHSHGFGMSENINVRAAIIHIIGDALQNVGVIIAGTIIYFKPHWSIVDPICTFIFAIIVFFSTTRILKDCVSVIMEGCPIDNVKKLEKRLEKVEGVTEVHDLHVWSLSMGKMSMTVHLKSTNPSVSLLKATELMNKKYNITHTTIQVEGDDHPEKCEQTLH